MNFLYLSYPGATASESSARFKDYIFGMILMKTPLNVAENGVLLNIVNGRRIYCHSCFQRLTGDELFLVQRLLMEEFGQKGAVPGSCAAWSEAAAAAGHTFGQLRQIEGGHSGRGEMAITTEHIPNGVFQ